jgi:hypothetical protein
VSVEGQDGDMRLPLLARNGAVRAHAIVDGDCPPQITDQVWRLDGKGYAARWERSGGRAGRLVAIFLHHAILGDAPEGLFADHVDRNRLDCRRVNLRWVTPQVNSRNRSPNRVGASRYRGVRRCGDRWEARAQYEGKRHYLGGFASEDAAAAAVRNFWAAKGEPIDA